MERSSVYDREWLERDLRKNFRSKRAACRGPAPIFHGKPYGEVQESLEKKFSSDRLINSVKEHRSGKMTRVKSVRAIWTMRPTSKRTSGYVCSFALDNGVNPLLHMFKPSSEAPQDRNPRDLARTQGRDTQRPEMRVLNYDDNQAQLSLSANKSPGNVPYAKTHSPRTVQGREDGKQHAKRCCVDTQASSPGVKLSLHLVSEQPEKAVRSDNKNSNARLREQRDNVTATDMVQVIEKDYGIKAVMDAISPSSFEDSRGTETHIESEQKVKPVTAIGKEEPEASLLLSEDKDLRKVPLTELERQPRRNELYEKRGEKLQLQNSQEFKDGIIPWFGVPTQEYVAEMTNGSDCEPNSTVPRGSKIKSAFGLGIRLRRPDNAREKQVPEKRRSSFSFSKVIPRISISVRK